MTQISLQPTKTPDPRTESLSYLIAQIGEQRGAFRNVTEESLREEIRKSEEDAIEVDEDDGASEAEDGDDEQNKIQRLNKAREEMYKHVFLAKDQSQMALDLVSHLSSLKYPGPASLTMSPLLKESVPTGTLGLDIVREPETSQAASRQNDLTAMGWRMQYLNKAADSLVASSAKLEVEVQKETAYWDQILAVKAKGWSLSRVPNEKHTMGVHFGFQEAHPTFRDRGFAPLRLDREDQLYLDRNSSVDSRIQLRMLLRGKPTAAFCSPQQSCEDALQQNLMGARDSLFDEELFFELNREAQTLASREVQCLNDTILLPCTHESQVEISLQDSPIPDSNDNSNSEHTVTLRNVLLIFRLLLSHSHRQTLLTRSEPPPPIRENPPPRPTYQIILPVLQHRAQMSSLRDLLTAMEDQLT